jgi:GT2 family glycosyltransferase
MCAAISVVVCTRNRVDSLRKCIRALTSTKTNYEWELIIVDNDSADGTNDFLSSLARQFSKTRVITTVEPRRGIGPARNKGITLAHGDIIAFTDDDCYVAENYIDAMISAFETGPEVGFVGGRILLYDPTDLRLTIQESEHQLILRPQTFVAAGVIQGANMAFRRMTLERIGGFDENFRYGGLDIDAVASALWAGIPGMYDPRPTVYHHHGRKTKHEAKKLMRIYAKGRGAYFTKYILRSDSRCEYIWNWLRYVKSDLRASFPRLPDQSLHELFGGLHYIAVRCWSAFDRDHVGSKHSAVIRG